MAQEINPWKVKSTKNEYENKWIKVLHHEVTTPRGTEGIYGKVSFKNKAVGIVVLDENLNTYLVGQYRFTLDEYSWEIPEGGCPQNEDILEAANRELREETGIIAQTWTYVSRIHTSNSVTDEEGHIYLAQDLSFESSDPEETEELQIKKTPFSEAIKMVLDNKITDSISIAGLLKVKLLLGL